MWPSRAVLRGPSDAAIAQVLLDLLHVGVQRRGRRSVTWADPEALGRPPLAPARQLAVYAQQATATPKSRRAIRGLQQADSFRTRQVSAARSGPLGAAAMTLSSSAGRQRARSTGPARARTAPRRPRRRRLESPYPLPRSVPRLRAPSGAHRPIGSVLMPGLSSDARNSRSASVHRAFPSWDRLSVAKKKKDPTHTVPRRRAFLILGRSCRAPPFKCAHRAPA